LYDLDGNLIDAYDTPDDFDMAANSLVKCHMRIEEGHIFLNFSRAAEPPPFEDPFRYGFERIGAKHDMAGLKVGTRKSYQIKANWKLGLENFMECYHCGASHDNLVATHNWDYSLSEGRRERWDNRVAEWIGPELAADRGTGSGGPYDGELNPGFITGSVDGKPLAPLLPGIKEWSHDTDIAITWFDTGYWQTYDDHIAVARFTPRGPELTDVEIFWLVHPDAVAGKDFDPEKLRELWDITIIEDAWIVENNHVGVKSRGYRSGRYTMHETQPSFFVAWYMREIVNG
jgi:Rieske 2Fe-2S family protein